MDEPQRKRAKVDEQKEDDIISNLDEIIRAEILSHLPIKEAIRTNTLSTKWRYTWTTIPELDIREAYFPSSKLPESRSRLVKFVDTLFLLHKGLIRNFKFSAKQCCHDALDRWILHLSRNGMSELILKLTSKRKYKLHSSFFSCKDLSSVYLCNCLVKLPQDYEGFKVLSELKLENCSLTGAEIERLVHSCPLLKDLSLRKFRERSGLRIDAPNLERLSIDGNFSDLQLLTPRLARACIDLEKNPSGESIVPKGGSRTNFSRAFCGVPEIKMLGIHRHFLQYLAQGNFLEENQVHTSFSHLKVLTLDIDLSKPEEIIAASFLFWNALTLEDLDVLYVPQLVTHSNIFLYGNEEEASGSRYFMKRWVDTDPQSILEEYRCVLISNSSKENGGAASAGLVFFFKHLKTVCLEDFVPTEPNLAFLRSILTSSPLLQTLTISSENADYDKQALVNHLYEFPRVSAFVNISHL